MFSLFGSIYSYTFGSSVENEISEDTRQVHKKVLEQILEKNEEKLMKKEDKVSEKVFEELTKEKEFEKIVFSMKDLIINPAVKYTSKRKPVKKISRIKYNRNRKRLIHKHQWQNRKNTQRRFVST